MTELVITRSHPHGIEELCLNRPERRNALTLEMILLAREKLKQIGSSSARCVILTGSGPAFCAGHDFASMHAQPLTSQRTLIQSCSELMLALQAMPQPVVAVVQGAAFGAGSQLALSCDLAVAASNATFATPGGKGGWFCFTPMVAVSRVLPSKRALEMLFSGEPVSAAQALEWGMINRVLPPELLLSQALEFAELVSRGSAASKALGKSAYYKQQALSTQEAYDFATEIMAESSVSPDAQETMLAFIEKRKASF